MIRILIVLQLILTFSLPNYTVSDELKAIERICEKVSDKTSITVYHGYAKYILDITSCDLKDAQYVLWDTHRGRLFAPITEFGEIKDNQIYFKGWKLLAQEQCEGFAIILLEKL